VRLGEVCKVVGGSTPDSANPDFWDGEVVWVTPTDLGKNHAMVIKSSSRKITTLGYESCSTEMLPTGTVIMSSRAPIGHLAIAGVPLCTNQGCKSFIPGPSVNSQFLYWLLKWDLPALRKLGSGATFAEVSKSQLEQVRVVLPPLPEQKRLAALLNNRLATVERARIALQTQFNAAKALPAAFLRQAFPKPGEELGSAWSWVRLADKVEFLTAKSIASAGDTTVRAITTACLSECGFDAAGIKTASMWSHDISFCRCVSGEILVARSNTPDLVGRASIYLGYPEDIVATDLTIRIRTHDGYDPMFLSGFLSSLFVRGFWKQNSGGASGSMKKIGRKQVGCLSIPLPPLSEQKRLAARLNEQIAAAAKLRKSLEAQLAEIEAFPVALLRKAFGGGL
jgi:type I restriction enzyme S subunit